MPYFRRHPLKERSMRRGKKPRKWYRLNVVLFLFALGFFTVLQGMTQPCQAESRALEQLLELLEQKGAVSSQEAATIRKTIEADRKRMVKKEAELKKKEQRLEKQEKALKEKEEALAKKESELLKKGEGPVPKEKEMAPPELAAKKLKKEKAVKKDEGIPLKATFDDGFWLSSKDDDLFALRIGGLLQADYRYYDYHTEQDPDKNKFDLRRVRLLLEGHILKWFNYKFQYEFQGAGSRRLLDAYVDTPLASFVSFRLGQYKEPFSLEQVTKDKNIPFAERSMGYYLTPGRDVGLMAHSALWDNRILYAVGIFNGDGVDDTVGGDCDSPEVTGRLVFAPFKNRGLSVVDSLQFGGSYSYAKADRNNVDIQVKTTGLTTFFDVNSSAKYNIIRDVDSKMRWGAELAWAYGPVLVWGEYTDLRFSDVKTSSSTFDINTKDYYGALLWMITGEHPQLLNGKIQRIRPRENLWQGGWGALGLAFRYDHFDAGNNTYQDLVEAGDSVQEATAYTLALNWYLNPYVRLLIDATRTNFDRPLLIDRDPLTGEAIYSDREDVVTGRLQLQF